jgi:serine/threonine-protein kinase
MMKAGSILAGRYQLVSLVGRGGMGEVWRAEHLGLRAPVAIKLMNPSIVADPDALARFNREAQAAAALRSPHVVQVLDHGVDPATDTPFIAMELMEGESLAHRLARLGRLYPQDVARIVTHVARALARAHEIGIIHRDLKPDNIFLVKNEDDEIAKVLDFGIAKANAQALGQSSATRTGTVMGTPYYMSPEQITGAKGLDHRADLWSLGVIACECMTGRQPFDGETMGALVIAICTVEAPRPSSLAAVPDGFDAWFARATARDVGARFNSARELSDALRQLTSGAPPPTTEAPIAAGGPRTIDMPAPTAGFTVSPVSRTHTDEAPLTSAPRKRGGGLLVSGVLAVLVVLGGASWFLLSQQKDAISDGSASAAAPTVPAVPPSAAVPAAALPAASQAPAANVSATPGRAPLVLPVPSALRPSKEVAPAAVSKLPPPKRGVPARPGGASPPPALPSLPNSPLVPAAPAKPPLEPSGVFDRRKG